MDTDNWIAEYQLGSVDMAAGEPSWCSALHWRPTVNIGRSMLDVVRSLARIRPYPVALAQVHGRGRTLFKDRCPAVIGSIPADGVQQELSVTGAPIFQRAAADYIMRQLGDKLRRQ